MVAVMIVESAIAGAMGMGEDQEVSELTETLLGTLLSSPLGILSIGLAAAIGEEPLFRGAAQPRFGLLVTSVLFALVHNNYGLSFATVIVFGLGLVLGLIRIRYNTTTSMITHAVYNSTLVTVSMLAVSVAQNAAK
ncbi:MAG: CPBP family intramembrane metalloprotease [Anaerolineales bacterium]|nr:CPBP family intramembrane metalloprotease [Anaerolineales bacterium]